MTRARPERAALPAVLVGALSLACAACGSTRSAAPRTAAKVAPKLPPAVVAYVTLVGTGSSLGLGDKVDVVDLSAASAHERSTLVRVGTFPDAVAVSPDGATAYVTNYASDTLTPIDVATGRALPPIPAGPGPAGVAIAPDGATAYVTDAGSSPLGHTVMPIDLATRRDGTPIPVGAGPQGIVITPNGQMAYVADAGAIVAGQSGAVGDTVTPVDLATGKALPPIHVGNAPTAVAVSPDGATVYVANSSSGSVTPISVVAGTAGTPVGVDGSPQALAFAPGDSSTLYVASAPSAVAPGDTVTPVSVTTGTAGPPVKVCKVPAGLAIHGSTAWVSCAGSGALVPLDLATRAVGPAIAVPGGPYAVAITTRAQAQGAQRARPKR